jgi:hypothetical protein
MSWAGHVAQIGKKKGAYRVLVGKPERKILLERPGVGGMIILKWIFRKWNGGWSGLICVIIGTGGGLL